LTNIYLRDWDRNARVWRFDISTGRVNEAQNAVCHGFAYVPAAEFSREFNLPRVAAAYSSDGILWFQADDKRWDMNKINLGHVQDETGLCKLRASVDGALIIDVSYPGPLSDPINRNDPTFDELDMELQDFFRFLTRNNQNEHWRNSVRLGWEEGFTS
jgi:hypothetical protein